jgi:hypothetical protein
VANTQDRRVYPNFGPVSRYDAGGNSTYQSLQWSLEKRFSHGLTMLANYTWSKNIDDLSATNPYDRSISRGLSGFDVPHNFKFSNVWEVPHLNLTSAAGKLLNGWEVNAILVRQSGFPFTVSSGQDNSFSNVGSDRADYIGGNPNLGEDRPLAAKLNQWFDTSRFVANAPGTFGNSGRSILRGPGFFNADLGVVKSTRITERTNLQFRGEFFNIFNHPNFRLPTSNISSSQRGRITAVLDDNQRIIQFGLKLMF